MKPFYIYLDAAGELLAEKKKVDTQGMTLVTDLRASSKSAAVKMAKVRIANQLITLPKTPKAHATPSLLNRLDPERPIKKAIYCDFNGVVDNGEVHHDRNIKYRLPKQTCPHKAMKIVKLALAHDAELIMISLHRHQMHNYNTLFGRLLRHSEIPEYQQFYLEHKQAIRRLLGTHPTGQGDNRRQEILEHIALMGYSHYVVFEDEHPIGDDLNEVRTCTFTGVTDEQITKASALLSQDMR